MVGRIGAGEEGEGHAVDILRGVGSSFEAICFQILVNAGPLLEFSGATTSGKNRTQMRRVEELLLRAAGDCGRCFGVGNHCAKFSIAELRLLPFNPEYCFSSTGYVFNDTGVVNGVRALVLVLFPRALGADGNEGREGSSFR